MLADIVSYSALFHSHWIARNPRYLQAFLRHIRCASVASALVPGKSSQNNHTSHDIRWVAVRCNDAELCSWCFGVLENRGYQPRRIDASATSYRDISAPQPFLLLIAEGCLSERTLEWCRQFSSGQRSAPILVLSADNDPDSELSALEAGADRYLRLPVAPQHLYKHIDVLRQRFEEATPWHPVTRLNLRADLVSRRAWAGGNELRLSPTLFDLLTQFLAHPGRVMTSETLLVSMRAQPRQPYRNAVKTYVCQLRKALAPHGLAHTIRTLHRVGYRYDPPSSADIR